MSDELTNEQIQHTLKQRSSIELLRILRWTLNRLRTLNQELPMRQSAADKDISRIYHRIESTRFNAYQGFVFARELQDSLRKRRGLKHDAQITTQVINWIGTADQDLIAIAKRLDQRRDDEAALSGNAAGFQQDETG